jgi:hypothetical protein
MPHGINPDVAPRALEDFECCVLELWTAKHAEMNFKGWRVPPKDDDPIFRLHRPSIDNRVARDSL